MGLAHPNPNPNPNPNQVGGGKGLSLGKDKVTRMVESFGGRVTGSVSGKTDILLVGKEPGYAKVSQAQSRGGIALLSLEDVRVSLIKGSVADAVRLRRSSPVEIEEFSAGISPLYLPHISPYLDVSSYISKYLPISPVEIEEFSAGFRGKP